MRPERGLEAVYPNGWRGLIRKKRLVTGTFGIMAFGYLMAEDDGVYGG